MKSRRKKSAAKEEVFTVVDLDEFETVCQVCEAEFLDEADLKLHVAQMHSKEQNVKDIKTMSMSNVKESRGRIICSVCCAVLPGPQEYVSHFIFKHLERSFFCYYCYRVFSDSSLLDQHKMKHCVVAGNSALTCSQCSTILINRQELQRHEYQEHMNSDDGFMLNHLFSLLSSALCMKITKFIDSKYMKRLIVCQKCQYSSSSTKLYVKHLKASKCRCVTCDKCFNVYKKKPSIVIHMKRCYFNTKKDVKKKCIKCNKYFDLKDLSAHKKSCMVIKCSACQNVFDTMNELADHREREHNARISLKTCKFCKRQFVGALSLKKHMNRSHKDPNQYKYNCVHCDSRFNHPSKLFGHFFTRHKDIKPYTCKICNKCYRLRKQFTLHIKLEHKSIGFVEFDENLHVIFTDKKSENPIAPQANVGMDSSTDASDSDCNEPPAKRPMKRNAKQPECKENVSTTPLDATESTMSPKNKDSNEHLDNSNSLPASTVQIEIESTEETGKDEIKDGRVNEKLDSPEELSDTSEDVPLSTMRKSTRKNNQISNIKRKTRDKRVKLTCKVCNKYCYTVQNFHHHMTLHEESTMKRCIKCNQYFRSKKELREHINSSHISSQLIDTLKTVVEKRKKSHPVKSSESFRAVLERRRKQQLVTDYNSAASKFRRTIQRVDISDNCTATMTPIMDEELSVKKFIENFKPEGESLSISNSVTIKTMTTPVVKEPLIKMRAFTPESYPNSETKLRFPVRFKDSPASEATKISVKLVQELVTKPSVINMHYNEKIPQVQEKTESDDYCNTFADETDYTEYKEDSIEPDYTQYKNDSIPDVAQEVMLEDVPQTTPTKQVTQEIVIPKIAKEHGEISIGHLLPQAPFFKIVKVKSLLNPVKEEPDPMPKTDVQLPDGTRLVSVKNPYSHLIPNDHLQEILKANSNRTKYYAPKAKNIEKAIAKACEVKPPRRRGRKISKKDS